MGGAPPSHSADQTRKLIAFSFLAISAVVAFDTRKLIATHPFLQERVLNLPWMAAACAVICVLRLLVSNAFRSLGEVLIRPRYTGSEREEKKDKFGTVCFKCLYMVVASYGGWRVLATRSWLPPVMRLGAGSYSNSVEGVYDGYPRDYEEMDFPVHAYYMVAGGWVPRSRRALGFRHAGRHSRPLAGQLTFLLPLCPDRLGNAGTPFTRWCSMFSTPSGATTSGRWSSTTLPPSSSLSSPTSATSPASALSSSSSMM